LVTKKNELKDRHIIGLISDTHIPDTVDSIDEAVMDLFARNEVELILHAGDLTEFYALEELKARGKVVGVDGNM